MGADLIPPADLIVADVVPLGEWGTVRLHGTAVEATDHEVWLMPTSVGPSQASMTIDELLSANPPYLLHPSWSRTEPGVVEALTATISLARAAITRTDPVEPVLMRTARIRDVLASLADRYPTPELDRMAMQTRSRLDAEIMAAMAEVDASWDGDGRDAWAIALLLHRHRDLADSTVGARWQTTLLACLLPDLHRFDDTATRHTARQQVPDEDLRVTVRFPSSLPRSLARTDTTRGLPDVVRGLLAHTLVAHPVTRSDTMMQAAVPQWTLPLLVLLGVHPHHPDRPEGPLMTLIVAGTPIPDAAELIDRYCGLTGEVWAYRFYDALPIDGEPPTRVDLLATAVMHGPLRRSDLQWFTDHEKPIAGLLADLPSGLSLAAAPNELRDRLADGIDDLTEGADGAVRSLLTKILHRRRPHLVVIEERAIGRRYAAHHEARGRLGYRDLLDAIADDLTEPATEAWLDQARRGLADRGVHPSPTALRLLDIAIWMDSSRRAPIKDHTT